MKHNNDFIKSESKSDNPWTNIGLTALATLIIVGIEKGFQIAQNWINTRVRTQAAKDLDDHKLKNAEKLEKVKTRQRWIRHRDDEVHLGNMERIRKRQRIRHREFTQQEAQEQASERPSFDTAPNLRSTEDVFNRPLRRRRSTGWIIDGYAKPGQITMIVAGADVGKSSLLAQTALDVAKGVRPEYLPGSCCASLKQDVVYYRIEDFCDELEGKYGAGEVLKLPNLLWVLPEDLGTTNLTAFLDHVKGLARTLERDTLVCADPVTKLDGFRHEACIKGLEEAQQIAKENGVTLTVIVAAHPNEINDSKQLTTEFIKGGDKGVQQAGSVIALRMEGTPGGDHRFIQCLKAPKGHPKPHPEGVIVCKYVKTQLDEDNSYLHFEFVEIKPEADARPEKPKAKGGKAGKEAQTDDKPKKKGNTKVDEGDAERMVELKAQGKTYEEIVELLHLPICPEQVGRIVRAEKAKNKDQEGDQAA